MMVAVRLEVEYVCYEIVNGMKIFSFKWALSVYTAGGDGDLRWFCAYDQ